MDGDRIFDTRGADAERLALFREQAELLDEAHRESLPIWALFGPGTRDYPGLYAARCGLSLPEPRSLKLVILGDTLEDVRAMLPSRLVMLGRFDQDPPHLVESWI